jgi:hypothetical protein
MVEIYSVRLACLSSQSATLRSPCGLSGSETTLVSTRITRTEWVVQESYPGDLEFDSVERSPQRRQRGPDPDVFVAANRGVENFPDFRFRAAPVTHCALFQRAMGLRRKISDGHCGHLEWLLTWDSAAIVLIV